VARLRELGWIEGRTVAIEYRWSVGRPERAAEFAAEFVRLKADVIVANNTSALVVKQATSIIPVVFVLAGDPSAAVSSPIWRDRAATSRACRTSKLMLLESDSNS
jgi:putative tryptophan/tyrosine transport system substrate-binding protein